MKKYKYLIIILLALILVSGYIFLNKEDVIEVSTMKSYTGNITKTLELSGVIDTKDIEVIPLEANQKVIKTYVKENDLVDSNQLLAELDTTDDELALRKAKVNLEELNANLNSLSRNSNDSLLLANQLTRSEEERTMLSSDLERAKDDLIKAEILYKEGAISKAEFDNYVTTVDKLGSDLKKAELNINDAKAKLNNFQDESSQDISSLQRQIRSLNLDIERLNKKIQDSKIYSNTSGFITEFPLTESNQILSGQKITIYGNSSYELEAQVSQLDAVLIKEGQKAIVQVDGLDNEYEGEVSFIAKTATLDNGATEPKVEIRLKITNFDDSILFGYEGNAIIMLDKEEDGIVVNNESIREEDSKKYVYVVDESVTRKVFVETGLTDGYLINIKSGLNENEVVVLNPPINLEEGINIKVRP